MIAVRLEGRMGNQLFQYAFIYAASKKLNTSFYLDKSLENFLLPNYFEVKHDFIYPADHWIFRISGFKNIFNYHLKRAFYRRLSLIFKLKKKSFTETKLSSETILGAIKDQTFYEGFFQSANYFKGLEADIRQKFSVKPAHRTTFSQKYGELYKQFQTVCVHIRRTDYLTLDHLNLGGEDLSLPLDYYTTAINRINKKGIHFVFIGDDKQFINDNFQHLANKTIAEGPDIIDFQHLLNADYCIIANSTFSWWGAWLNSNPNKTIYAPQYFLGWRVKKEIPREIYPGGWIQIEF